MKVRCTAVGTAAVFPLGAAVTVLSFEGMPPERLRQEGALVTPAVGKTATPVEPYVMVVGVAALAGSWIYFMARFLKGGAGGRGGG